MYQDYSALLNNSARPDNVVGRHITLESKMVQGLMKRGRVAGCLKDPNSVGRSNRVG